MKTSKATPIEEIDVKEWHWGRIYIGTRDAIVAALPVAANYIDALPAKKRVMEFEGELGQHISVSRVKGHRIELRYHFTEEEKREARIRVLEVQAAEEDRVARVKRFVAATNPEYKEFHARVMSSNISAQIIYAFNLDNDREYPFFFDDEVLAEARDLGQRLLNLLKDSQIRIKRNDVMKASADQGFQTFVKNLLGGGG